MKLHTHNIAKSYKGRKVVKGISVEVKQGEIVGLLGPNGAGKTTSFYMIVGLVTPDGGKVFLDEQEITQRRQELNQLPGLRFTLDGNTYVHNEENHWGIHIVPTATTAEVVLLCQTAFVPPEQHRAVCHS